MGIPNVRFQVLRELSMSANPANPQLLALNLALPKIEVAAELDELEKLGWIFGGRITKAGAQALEPYKVDNAIILAAEFKPDFVPLSYEKPPCLFTFRGEVLIERLIRQLREAGIRKIYVVGGDKAEQLFHLEKEYGVQVVFNPEYQSRGSHSSLMAVRSLLSNSYICDSCDYFLHNPFRAYEHESYCALCYSKGETPRYCVRLERDGSVTDPELGGEDSWCLKGQVFASRELSQELRRVLKEEYADPRTCPKSWLEFFTDRFDECRVAGRICDPNDVCSLKSISQAASIDPDFMTSGKSQIFDNIVDVLGCDKSEIRSIYSIDQGLTNYCFHFQTDGGEWTYRHPGAGNDKLVDYAAEVEAQQVAKRIGLYDSFIHEDPHTGWMIARYIPKTHKVNFHNEAALQNAMNIIRMLHGVSDKVSRSFDFYEEGCRFASELLEKSDVYLPAFNRLSNMAAQAKAIAQADEKSPCLCHNDFSDTTLIMSEDGVMRLVEWDYAGMSDYASDFGTMVVSCQLSEHEALRALEFYFGRTPTQEEVCHNFAYVGLAAWCWYVWSLLKEAEGAYVGDWLFVYHRYAKEYLAKASWIAESLGII